MRMADIVDGADAATIVDGADAATIVIDFE